jgi:acid phosphatase type 7
MGDHGNSSFNVVRIVEILVVLLSVLLLVYLLTGHGALDDITLYTKTLLKLAMLVALTATTAALLVRDIRRKIRPSAPTVVVSLVTLTVTLYFASLVMLPRYIRHGCPPAPNLLSSSSEPRTFHFAAAGDPHIGSSESRTDLTLQMLRNIARDKYDAFFLLGDLVDLGYNHDLWVKALKNMQHLNSAMPVCYIPGNHDTMYGGDRFFKTFCLADQKEPLWRRIDIGNIHFIVLDIEWLAQTYTQNEEQWLARQLADIPANDWCIVVSHSFYYCSGRKKDGWNWYDNDRLIKKLCPLFESHGVDLVLSGHMHQAEILQKNGVTYAVVGSFGGKLDRGREYVSPASIWYKARQFGYLDVSINGNDAELKVRDPEDRELFSMKLSKR